MSISPIFQLLKATRSISQQPDPPPPQTDSTHQCKECTLSARPMASSVRCDGGIRKYFLNTLQFLFTHSSPTTKIQLCSHRNIPTHPTTRRHAASQSFRIPVPLFCIPRLHQLREAQTFMRLHLPVLTPTDNLLPFARTTHNGMHARSSHIHRDTDSRSSHADR